jgi:hypothetical protein
MLKVSEIAKKLGKSKTAVYKNANRLKDELKPHKKKHNGVIHYTLEGYEILKRSFDVSIIETKVETNSIKPIDNKYLDLLLSDKEKQIKHLKEQLKEKDKLLEQSMELVKNNQILLLQSKEKILMLESPTEKKSFWSKFKKNSSIK